MLQCKNVLVAPKYRMHVALNENESNIYFYPITNMKNFQRELETKI